MAPFEADTLIAGMGLPVVKLVVPDRIRDLIESRAAPLALEVLAHFALRNIALTHRLGIIEIAEV
ncbi:MAG TPA: hypothetical protein VNJ47_00280 [Nevskiales bacterium]|nr:hypothetical protein [Nevskiales bacterium]